MNRAERAWRAGDIEEAADLAKDREMRFRTAYVRGRYEEALSYRPDVDALLHLDRPAEAARLARRPGPLLRLRAERPLSVTLDGPTTLAYADHPLAPYLPAVPATVDGRPETVHLDTGGTFLVMGTERARALGVTLVEAGRSFHGARRTRRYVGMVGELCLGAARLTNVPVEALPTLTGPQDVIVAGTNILQRLRATVDHPGRTLTLAPRGAAGASAGASAGCRVPFYLWGSHFMFARGGLGHRRDRTWFVDSGLVHVVDGRSAAIMTRTAERDGPLRLGDVTQERPFVIAAPRRVPWRSFGGVRIDGLLTLGFLGRHRWTVDFDQRVYTFVK